MKLHKAGPGKDAAQELTRSLLRELGQAERSAQRHPRIEAERLGNVPPAHAMRRAAEHADEALPALSAEAERLGMSVLPSGVPLGEALSQAREKLGDLLLTQERSYRGTLAGLRHGVDVLVALEHVARRGAMTELADCARRLLHERERLVEDVGRQLGWFAAHPDRALERGPLARRTLEVVARVRRRGRAEGGPAAMGPVPAVKETEGAGAPAPA